MAYFKQIGSRYQFQIRVNGIREARSFANKKDGQTWAARREMELLARGPEGEFSAFTLKDVFDRYIREVAPKHKGARMETLRLRAFERDRNLPMDVPLGIIAPTDIKHWRDVRFRAVSEGSVLREMNLLSAVFEVAKTEWGWIESNPVRAVKKPRSPKHRESVWNSHSIKKVLKALNYQPQASRVETATQAVALAFLLALRTGMRAGELCNLTWRHTSEMYVTLVDTKNGSNRSVPLSQRARRLIAKAQGRDETLVLGLSSATLDALFRRAKTKAGLDSEDLVFHDTRHTAATWLAKDLAMLDLCKMFGWRNPKFALVYYNPDPRDIARQLDSRRTLGVGRSNLDRRFSDAKNKFPTQ